MARLISDVPGAELMPWEYDDMGDAEFNESGFSVVLRGFPDGGVDCRTYKDDLRLDKDTIYNSSEADVFQWAVEQVLRARKNDPRLAHLPDDLRAIAAEFLDLHEAWGTEFKANADDGFLEIGWQTVWPETYLLHQTARFRFEGRRQAFYPEGWGVEWRENDRAEGPWTRGQAASQLPTLRRSADFAEFVQRFRKKEDEEGCHTCGICLDTFDDCRCAEHGYR